MKIGTLVTPGLKNSQQFWLFPHIFEVHISSHMGQMDKEMGSATCRTTAQQESA